jgi:hypothetical protein
LAGIEELPKEGLFFKVNKDVVKFISENDIWLALLSVNWLYQPSDMKDLKKHQRTKCWEGEEILSPYKII